MQILSALQYLAMFTLGAASILAILSNKPHVSALLLIVEVLALGTYIISLSNQEFLPMIAIAILVVAIIFFAFQIYYAKRLSLDSIQRPSKILAAFGGLMIIFLHKKFTEAIFMITHQPSAKIYYKMNLSSMVIIFFAIMCILFCGLTIYSSRDNR